MLRPRKTLLSAGLLAVALSVSACSGDTAADNAPPPAEAIPSEVAPAVGSDVGQFLVKPTQGTVQSVIDGAVAKLKSLPGVETVSVNDEGFVDVVIRPKVPQEQRDEIVKQMAGLGEVIEGI